MTQKISAERKIRDALVDLLIKKPFHKITVTDITSTAHINRSTYYYHYYKIDEVLDKVIQVAVEDLIEIMLKSISSHGKYTIDNRILPSTKIMFSHIYKYRKYYTALIGSDVSNRFSNTFVIAITDFNSRLKVTFNDDIDLLINRKMHDNFYAYAAFGQVKYWIDNDFEHSAEYMAEQLTNFMFMKVENIVYRV